MESFALTSNPAGFWLAILPVILSGASFLLGFGILQGKRQTLFSIFSGGAFFVFLLLFILSPFSVTIEVGDAIIVRSLVFGPITIDSSRIQNVSTVEWGEGQARFPSLGVWKSLQVVDPETGELLVSPKRTFVLAGSPRGIWIETPEENYLLSPDDFPYFEKMVESLVAPDTVCLAGG
ncbi:MAG TPA: hypothetical protein P5560_05675 [Thermotogota bacterium]|nr:hypothetical protein [Thermotogota bacterium]HRW92429.1 hypothetical protein [Thermotogota bacterium]